MRRLAAVLWCVAASAAAVGCGAPGGASAGPAWPRSASAERTGLAADDGGESLQPKVAKEAVAVEASADEAVPVAAEAPKPKPADPGGGGAAAPQVAPSDPDTPVMLDFEEEIVIDATGQ